MRRADGEVLLLWTLAGAGNRLALRLPAVPWVRPADVSNDVGGAGRRLLPRSGEPPAHPLQHDRLQLVRGRSDSDPGADRVADPQDGPPHADLLVRHHRVRGRRPHDLLDGQSVLAARRLPPGAGSAADPSAQRSRVGDLLESGRIPDRAERDPRARDLSRPPGATGLPALGGALQSRRRRSADPGCVRGSGDDGPHRLGRPADVLGAKRRHRRSGSS